MVGRGVLILSLLSPGLLWIPGWPMVEAGVKLGQAGQLPCTLEISPDLSKSQNGEPGPQWQEIQLVLSGSGSKLQSHQGNSDTFLFQDKARALLPHMNEDVDKLECKMSRYFTANTQIMWPGLPRRPAQIPTWYLLTITHIDDEFMTSTFCFQTAESAEDAGPASFSGVFSLYTKASQVQVKLQGTIFLECGFVVDHVPKAVDVKWVLRQKGGKHRELLTYSGIKGKVTHLLEQVEAFPSEIPHGNASIRLINMAVKDEGSYFCSVNIAGLHGELGIHVAVLEAPKVTLSPQTPTLTLEEGEEQKLVCDVNRYFPLEAHVDWLREPVEGRMLPEVVKNVLYGSHRKSGDGTFSFSSHFLLTASLRDNGVHYTCRVQHKSLKFPIKKSIMIRVKERSRPWLWLLLPIFVLLVVLFYMLKYLHEVKSMNKRKPY